MDATRMPAGCPVKTVQKSLPPRFSQRALAILRPYLIAPSIKRTLWRCTPPARNAKNTALARTSATPFNSILRRATISPFTRKPPSTNAERPFKSSMPGTGKLSKAPFQSGWTIGETRDKAQKSNRHSVRKMKTRLRGSSHAWNRPTFSLTDSFTAPAMRTWPSNTTWPPRTPVKHITTQSTDCGRSSLPWTPGRCPPNRWTTGGGRLKPDPGACPKARNGICWINCSGWDRPKSQNWRAWKAVRLSVNW